MSQAIAASINLEASKSRWQVIFLFLVAVLSSTILLKIGQVQYLEVLYLLQTLLLIATFISQNYQATFFRPFLRIGILYVVLCVLALALAIASLRFRFYPPDLIDVLKYPVIITLVRIVELGASVSIMLYLASEFRKHPSKTRFTMRIYFWVGVASGVYSILSYPLDRAGIISLGSYSEAHRLRGFYNEGGPYGLYVLSLFLIGVALYKQQWESRRTITVVFALLAVVLVMSGSKAAVFATFVLFLCSGFFAGNTRRRVAYIAFSIVFLLAVSQIINIDSTLRAYRRASGAYERLSHLHRDDPNFIYGRVAGAFIVPRMIAAHPLTGVGWGNYGILRNSDEYRGAAAWANLNDEPGLGLFGLAAEFGIPLIALALLCLFLPFLYLRRLHAPAYLSNLALLQPIVHLFGAQLNLTYPWVVTAFALGLSYSLARSQPLQTQA